MLPLTMRYRSTSISTHQTTLSPTTAWRITVPLPYEARPITAHVWILAVRSPHTTHEEEAQ